MKDHSYSGNGPATVKLFQQLWDNSDEGGVPGV